MAAINLRIEVPNSSAYDLALLKKQLTDFARILISSSKLESKAKEKEQTSDDPFSCFSGDWGGRNKSAHDISEELRSARKFTHIVENWE